MLYILAHDVVLKRFLNRIALSNWQKTQPHKFGNYNTLNPKSTADTGIIACPEETKLEEPLKLQNPKVCYCIKQNF